ncbi:MAG: hypothetical protein JXR23_09035 [Pontiellaceae bacterium]|nr:hypothetical protein [Pontiellaceae bacterium]
MRLKLIIAAWPQLLLAGFVVLGSGCQSARNAVYCIGEDLTDIFVADATVSLGTDMGAHVMATELLQVKAYSYEDLYRFGLGARRFGIWECEREGWDFSLVHSSRYSWNQQEVAAFAPLSAISGKMASRSGAKAMFAESVDEFGVGVHLFVVGGRIGFRPLEVVDLFANLLTLDPLHDNLEWWQRQSIRSAEKAAKKAAKQAEKEGVKEEQPTPEAQTEGLDTPLANNVDEASVEAMQQEMERIQQQLEIMQQLYLEEPAF